MAIFIRFIRRIRNADLAVRKRWLVVFTVPTMALVVLLWAAYMRASIGAPASGEAQAAAPERVGAFTALAAGWGIVADRMENGVVKVARFLRGGAGLSRTIELNVRQGPVDFTAEELGEVPRTTLP